MLIDPQKIMVVHNTQYANSKTVADYYAAARGLNTDHVQGYNFGTADTITSPTNRDTFRDGVLTDIANYIAANGIQGIAVSINCPSFYQNDETQASPADKASLCLTLSAAHWITHMGGTTRPFNPLYALLGSVYWPEDNTGSEPWTRVRLRAYPVVIAGTYAIDWYNYGRLPQNDGVTTEYYNYTACGRLGYHVGMGADDAALAMRCIDDAVWFEQNGNPLNETMLFGFSSRAAAPNDIGHGNVWDAYRLVADRITCEVYDGNYANAASTKYAYRSWGFDMPTVTIPDQATWLAGGGPVKELWGWLGSGLENTGNVYLPSADFTRGAWMFEATSSGVSKYSLAAGACAAIVPLQEPFALGLPEIGGLAWNLLHGYSLAEASIAAQASNFGYSTEVWGDPFYTPFMNVRLPHRSAIALATDN